ncbi:MAG: hydroxyethylthiazole kinase [Cellulosilyticaceae bacterium]
MTTSKYDIEKLIHIKEKVMREEPLIHGLTHPITMNDCANVILAVGGRPIMAEHPKEVREITQSAKALVVNLGNISESRMTSMMLSGNVTKEADIPCIIDCVGVACSDLRLTFAKQFVEVCQPQVIKGNMSEIKAMAGVATNTQGIDVAKEDRGTKETIGEHLRIVRSLAKAYGTVVVATGKLDIISDGERTYIIENGCEALTKITGTGCMVGMLIGTFISQKAVVEGALLGTLMMGLSGELAQDIKGVGSFKVAVFDYLSTLDGETLLQKAKVKVVDEDDM